MKYEDLLLFCKHKLYHDYFPIFESFQVIKKEDAVNRRP